jgi:SAM-dependent methyltransferase
VINTSQLLRSKVPGRVQALLKSGIEARQHQDPDYLDVLDSVGPRRDQGMFRRGILPPVYERLWRPVIARMIFGTALNAAEERTVAFEMLRVSLGDRVIDVGCGPGNYTRHLADAVGDGLVVGVDASKAMITRAAQRRKAPNVAYMRADACELPFVDLGFDAVCCIGVLHMLDEPMRALNEMVRVLAPGGRMVMVVTHEKKGVPRVRGSITAFGHDDMTRALSDRGLVDIEQRVVRRGQFVAGSRPSQQ